MGVRLLKFFNHYIALPTLLLATVEVILFFILLLTLTTLGSGPNNLLSTPDTHGLIDLIAICAFFLALLSAIGFYNRDAVFELGTLLQRSVLFLFIVVFIGFLAWIIDDLTPSWSLSGHLVLFALATILNFLVILTIRVIFISFPKFDIFKRRVLVLGNGQLGSRIHTFLSDQGAATLHEVGYVDLSEISGQPNGQDVTIQDLSQYAENTKADEIVIASREWRVYLCGNCWIARWPASM